MKLKMCNNIVTSKPTQVRPWVGLYRRKKQENTQLAEFYEAKQTRTFIFF